MAQGEHDDARHGHAKHREHSQHAQQRNQRFSINETPRLSAHTLRERHCAAHRDFSGDDLMEFLDHRLGVCVPLRRILGHRSAAKVNEFRRNVRARLSSTAMPKLRKFRLNRAEQFRKRRHLMVEIVLQRDELVEDNGRRIEIGTRIDDRPSSLLGGHVRRRTDEGTVAGCAERAVPRVRHVPEIDLCALHLCHAPIHEPNLTEATDHDVRRLHVAVDDAPGMGEGERTEHTDKQLDTALKVPRCEHALIAHLEFFNECFEGFPLDVLHHKKVAPIGVHTDVMEGDDVRMFEGADDANFGHEAGDSCGAGRLGEDALDGDRSTNVPVDRLFDFAHPTDAERLLAEEAFGGFVNEARRPAFPRLYPREDAPGGRPKRRRPRKGAWKRATGYVFGNRRRANRRAIWIDLQRSRITERERIPCVSGQCVERTVEFHGCVP
ncbi:hypothetical protein OUZ56_032617, partial [Daphnia magna]